ncbi:cysteine--1-D-myo-inosityl 2-amino-2-deoxy-alpha-D-glucopyranoside ligase [Myceligenerans pegani]|uniref:L-cysteine:1D-myo-inositol 2-amino-2-deoxy-alpha-D-glucopyranoside ligase n=1 Tax=Myceligenerans pegani TaxID=2776917 RepID=A0ABR9MZA2_9MICO|nr:cysteine--1-D-myo-inosityl 2-amino-2-deoxy-alpha-D-glucopyranoside ligase [Myceligenerans sp. TRM 65318]MBE1876721.1 cysteine--1-D-myo-inosityl 2-amino-2-deoxy-alpha-D-glucopyranoside ligase [Myceligenerans sp. TRM 65318]MBE3018992.1 cysteine--1-D-myo-inosityl 2-amino-2-deoxy-alpha-D-glucopyranoside ligase [Myceligenerans sp. TRM 65318]
MRSWPLPQIPVIPGSSDKIQVHDTSTGGLVEAAPGATAGLYVCGITPYDATHIGHANTYVAFDLLVRAWRDAGKEVTFVSNVTDVDDPLLERAAATGVDWRDLAREQVALFAEDMTALGVVPPDVYRGVVESVSDVAAAVTAMLESGAAYRVPAGDASPAGATGDDVYADVSADARFGDVSRLDAATMGTLFAERGGDPDRPGKRDPLDPLLWRAERPGEPAWDGGALGRGRPGWHIECAVIARSGLGLSGSGTFDVQGGGADLVFPHHEMSISHLRALGVEPAGAHVHAALIAYEGEKMSKSRGNLVLVSRLRADGADPMAIRLALLAHHYRTTWEWTDADLATGAERLERWRAAVSGNGGPPADDTLAAVRAALAHDLDAPAALAAVDAWVDEALDPSRDTASDEEGAPGVLSRAVNALLGVLL